MITQSMILDMVPTKEPVKLYLSQNDENYTLIFSLFARMGTFTIQGSTAAAFVGTLPDGTSYRKPAHLVGTTVTVAGDSEMTAAAGQGVFEIELEHNGKYLHSSNVLICFEKTAMEENE